MTDKTTTKTVRIGKEVADFYVDKPIRAILEEVYTLINNKQMEFDGESLKILKTEDGVYTPNCDLANIERMAACCDMSLDAMLKSLCQMLESGEITCRKGFIYVQQCPFDYKRLMDLCIEIGITPQEAIDKCCQMIARER